MLSLATAWKTMAAPSTQLRVSVVGNTLSPRLYRKTLGAAIGAVLSGLVFIDSKAQALVVTVNSQDWEVTTFTGTYNDNVSKFNTLENGGEMPWWVGAISTPTSAISFSKALAAQHGIYNWQFAAYRDPCAGFCNPPIVVFRVNNGDSAFTGSNGPMGNGTWNLWATARLSVPAPSSANVPGPLPILGLAAAFGFSRKLRKRINLHKGTSAVSTPPGA